MEGLPVDAVNVRTRVLDLSGLDYLGAREALGN
jgi:hypothetical protein